MLAPTMKTFASSRRPGRGGHAAALGLRSSVRCSGWACRAALLLALVGIALPVAQALSPVAALLDASSAKWCVGLLRWYGGGAEGC